MTMDERRAAVVAELLAELRAAPAGTRELSNRVLVALGWDCGGLHKCLLYWHNAPTGHSFEDGEQPDPSCSIDDIVALFPPTFLPSFYPGQCDDGSLVYVGQAIQGDDPAAPDAPAVAATPALALCVALLEAEDRR